MIRDLRRIWFWPALHQGALVLDIGSGAGDFARAARARGWKVDTLEPTVGDPTAEAWADEAPIQHYDAIFAWQVVEHLRDPLLVVATIRHALRPGGYFVFSVPSVRSIECWLTGRAWDAGSANLWHRHWLSPAAVRYLLWRAGFRSVTILHQRIVKHVRGPWWFTLALGCLVATLRISSRITVVARP